MSKPYVTESQLERAIEQIKSSLSPSEAGLDIIYWDGERRFTVDEIEKLHQFKAVVHYNSLCYVVGYNESYSIWLYSVSISYNTNEFLFLYGITIDTFLGGSDYGKAEHYTLEGIDLGTKLYKHELSDPNGDAFDHDCFISPYPSPLTSKMKWNDCRERFGFPQCMQQSHTRFWNFTVDNLLMVTCLELNDAGSFNILIDEAEIDYSDITDTVTGL